MKGATLVPVAEYLTTVYEPDCEYVDGEVVERNLGEFDHARLQLILGAYFFGLEKRAGVCAMTDQRVQVAPGRYRVPDVCVVRLPRPTEKVLTQPPFLCVEILSSEDRMSRVHHRIDDLLSFGVSYVWLIDPEVRRGWMYTAAGVQEAKDGVLRTENPNLAIDLVDLFAAF